MPNLLSPLSLLPPNAAAGQSSAVFRPSAPPAAVTLSCSPLANSQKAPFVFNPISYSPDGARHAPPAQDLASLAQVRMVVCCLN